MDHLLTTSIAAEMLGVSPTRVRKLIQEGRLPATKHGRDFLLQTADVEQFAATGKKSIGRPKKTIAHAQ